MPRTAALDTLRAALRGEPLPRDLSQLVAQDLVELAARQGLAGFLLSLDTARQLPEGPRDLLRRVSVVAATSHLRTQADLRWLTSLLDPLGVDWLVVKGPVLSEHWYAYPGQRAYGDLDVLVDPLGLPQVLAALEEGGCQLVDTNWSLSLSQRRAELSLLLPHGTPLDLHWHLLNTPALRAALTLPSDALLARRRPVALNGCGVTTLDQVDTLIHLAFHTLLSGGRQLSWYRDIAAVVSHPTLDEQVLITRSQLTGGGALVAVALERTAAVTGLSFAPDLLRSLAPRGVTWRRVIRALDRARPLGDLEVSFFSGQLLVSAGRSTTRSSLRAVLSEVRHDVVEPLLHDPDHPWRARPRHRPPVVRPNALWAPPAASGDRVRYLAEVRREVLAAPAVLR